MDTAHLSETPDTDSWSRCFHAQGGDNDIFDKVRALRPVLETEGDHLRYLFRRPILSHTRNRVLVEDPETGRPREMIMMGSNSFLCLNSDPRVVQASIEAAEKYGYGTGAVSLYTGTTDLHIELEQRIAAFYGCEDCILFPTGYAANNGAISGLARATDTLINDMFNHVSIFDGCLLSGGKILTYLHRNTKHLKKQLMKKAPADGGTLVITDGVFSMEGDVAPLDEIHALCRSYGARLMIDEAHAVGIIGPTGRGTAEEFGLQGEIDVTIGTLSKAPGGLGGYAVGSRDLVDYLRYYARPYFFSTSLPAPVVAGLIEVFRIFEEDPEPRRALWQNIDYMKQGLVDLGFDTGNSRSAIIPIIVGYESTLRPFAEDIFRQGIVMNYVAYPAVPRKRCRLRMNILSQHTREDLDTVLTILADLGRKHGIIGR